MTSILLAAALLFASSSGSTGEEAVAPGADDYRDNACITCHENLPGRLSGVVQEWKTSIHSQNKVVCDGCHGGDADVRRDQFDSDDAFKERSHLRRDSAFFIMGRSSERFISSVRGRNVSYFCGKCHAKIKEKHLGSPHGDLGSPTCLFCHGGNAHRIQESHIDIIDPRPRSQGGRCATCHRTATMETVADVKTILINAQDQLSTSSEQYAWLEKHGYKNLALEQMYHHSKETLSQLRQTFHSFNMREINNFASAIKGNAEQTKQTYDMIKGLERAKARQARIGTGVGIFLLAFAGLLLCYRKVVLGHTGST